MPSQWSQTSLPEDSWCTGSAQDHSTYVQNSSSEWDAQTLFSSVQDFQPMDAFAWTNTSQGFVDAGLSPVLSHQSQSSHTLNSLSEPELPSALDLSFTFEPTWNTAGSMVCHDAPTAQRQLPGNTFVPTMEELPFGPRMDGAMTQWTTNPNGCSSQPLFYSHGGQTVRPPVPSPAVAPPRTLLPRTEGSLVSTTPAFAQTSMQRPSRTSIQGRASSRRSSQSVSNNGYAVHESPRIEAGHYLAPRTTLAGVSRTSAMEHFQTLPPSDALPRTYAQDSISVITDPAAEEFTAFIQYDQDEQPNAVGSSSYSASAQPAYAAPVNLASHESIMASCTKIEPDTKPIKVSPKSAAALPSEVDEGRYRNHPLYSKGPDADGMFRCPFKAKENCPHKDTKLKCNYDKFVDSHLKPFRCRQDACAKQEFSSTACLLRHEREAHGMHGHGDRPHLCFYASCERGLPGNGFPRRYNLFDHMKRVHDHKEDTASSLASPETAAVDTVSQKKTAGRKRKAFASISSESPAQKLKTTPQLSPQAPAQRMSLPNQELLPMPVKVDQDAYVSHGYQWPGATQSSQYPAQSTRTQGVSRSQSYPHWNGQSNLVAGPFDFIQSPMDDAGMAPFDRNFQDHRRLSNDTRHG